jgi:hypothetical protein
MWGQGFPNFATSAAPDLAPFRCRQVAVGPFLAAIRDALPCTAVLPCASPKHSPSVLESP